MPGRMPHPGEILLELYLDAKGWSQSDLARAVGCSTEEIDQVVKGKIAISPDLAKNIASALGTSAQMWTRLQSDYDLFVAKSENGKV